MRPLRSGTQNTNFYRTVSGYDEKGRPSRKVNALGTITDTVFDAKDRVISTWVGTDDTPSSGMWSPSNNSSPCNMIEVANYVYDGGSAGGDSTLTQSTVYVDTTSADNRVTDNYYDWRDRLIASKQGVSSTETDGVHRPITVLTLDNLNRATTRQSFDGDGTAPSVSGGNVSPPSSSLLRLETVTSYDDQNRVYESQTFSVDQSAGTLSTYALTTNTYYDHQGRTLETANPGGLVTKLTYDDAGRVLGQFTTDGSSGSGWSNASDYSDDIVLEETVSTYDSNSNVIMKRHQERFPYEDPTVTGPLENPSGSPASRVTFVEYYFDAANRLVGVVDAGTNNGTWIYTRPSTIASRSDTKLVTTTTYNAAGWPDTITDPRGLVTANYYDMMGRVTRRIEAYDGTLPPDPGSLPTVTTSTDRPTVFTYDGLSHITTLEAVMPSGTNSQYTQYDYGVTTGGGSFVNSYDLLATVQYPDASTGAAGTGSANEQSFVFNAAGQPLTFTDQNGSVHTYTYDVLGRRTADAITTAGSGVDTAVLAQTISFDTGDRPYLLTSFNSATGRSSGNVVNQVEDLYNGLGQLTNEYQEHGGTVNTSTSKQVQYAWNLMASGVNNSRLTSMTYPNSRVLTYDYGTGGGVGRHHQPHRQPDRFEHFDTDATYTYLGLNTVINRTSRRRQSSSTSGAAPAAAATAWTASAGISTISGAITSGPTTTDEFKYTYDRDGNALYKNNTVVTSLSELYHANSSASGDNATAYDNLSRLDAFIRGTLSASGHNSSGLDTVSSASSLSSHSELWSLDTLGNWAGQTIDGTATSRTHNSKNELTAVGSNSLTFDNNGNTLTDEAGQTYTYDAWNRLVKVKNSGGTTLATYVYDPHGWRIQETHSGTTTDIYFTSQWQPIEERQSGTVTSQYVWGLDYVDDLILRDDNSTSGDLGITGSGLGRRLCRPIRRQLEYHIAARQRRHRARAVCIRSLRQRASLDSSGSSTTDRITGPTSTRAAGSTRRRGITSSGIGITGRRWGGGWRRNRLVVSISTASICTSS